MERFENFSHSTFKECCIKANAFVYIMRIGCYTKLPFSLQSIQADIRILFAFYLSIIYGSSAEKGYKFKKDQKIENKIEFCKNDEEI